MEATAARQQVPLLGKGPMAFEGEVAPDRAGPSQSGHQARLETSRAEQRGLQRDAAELLARIGVGIDEHAGSIGPRGAARFGGRGVDQTPRDRGSQEPEAAEISRHLSGAPGT
jgi:hypothetical protein